MADKKAIAEMHDNPRYHKNVLYITAEQQDKIKDIKIVFAGVGLGSVIAESLLRLGFENFIFIDGDEVEMSNLNRQNYIQENVQNSKVASIANRLRGINNEVKISYHNIFLEPNNIKDYVSGCDIAINAIDFDTLQTPFVFDECCKELEIPVIHPLNFGWAGAAYVVTPTSEQIYDVARSTGRFELVLIKNMLDYFENKNDLDLSWFHEFYNAYKEKSSQITPPQLVVGSYLAASLVTNIAFCLSNGLEVKTFPTPYFLSTR